jgi:undecaprenyl-diphosphatase
MLFWKKFFNFKSFDFYIKLGLAVIPALVLGKLFDDKIEAILEKPIPIAIVLIVGGIVLLFVDRIFLRTTLDTEEKITIRKAVTIGFWQCLAMMPGTSRAAASIIGGMQQGLTRKMAAEFSFFLAVPTMLAVTVYSVVLKDWNYQGEEQKGYEMILSSNNNMLTFALGNVIAFVVAALAIKMFIGLIQKYGFKIWGWYRIVVGAALLIYFTV